MLQVSHLTKDYQTPRGPLAILSDISLAIENGTSVSIVGPSGSGKSTFLYILGALEPPSSGTVTLDGQDIFRFDERSLAAFRNRAIGFVFQDHYLLPQCSVLENVLIPTLAGRDTSSSADEERTRALTLLEAVGLRDRVDHLPAQLSGGEKQRAALARALIRRPRLLLCDEPTGNLDRQSAETVAALLFELQQKQSMMLALVTHSADLAARCERRFELVERTLRER